MPTYSFRNKNTGKEWTEMMSMADRESFLENNPDIEQVIVPVTVLDSWNVMGGSKPDAAFSKYVLGKVRDKVPGAERSQFERRWKIPKEF